MLPHQNRAFVNVLLEDFVKSQRQIQHQVVAKLMVKYTIACDMLAKEWGCDKDESDRRIEQSYMETK